MRRRALQAMETNSHWSPMRTDEPHVTEASHLAFWVAVTGTSGSGEEIIGSLGLRIVGDAASATIDTADFSGLRPGRGMDQRGGCWRSSPAASRTRMAPTLAWPRH
jgi:hypothetical protein